MRHILFAAGLLAALVLGAAAGAETVVLADGTSLEGQVSTLNGRVTIVTAQATLTLPADKVLRVGRAPVAAPATAPAPEKPAPAQQTPAPRQPAGPTPLSRALVQKIDVSFDAAPPADVFDYVRQVTNVNLVVDNDVRNDTHPLTLSLHDVSLASVLDLVSEMNGYTYEVRPGQILFVRSKTAEAARGAYVARIYHVTDLLVSTEDTGLSPGTQGARGQGTSSGSSGLSTRGSSSNSRNRGLNPQFSVPAAGAPTITGAAPVAGVLAGRAQGLALLIVGTCGEGTWAEPAVMVP